MKKNYILSIIFSFAFALSCFAQDDLMKWAQQEATPKNETTINTFKDTRLINQQTLECLGARSLNVIISHRFGEINSGSYNAWGIDGPTNVRIGLDYSYDGRLMAGIGRSSIDKLFDGFLKYRLIRQTENGSMPVSVTLFTSIVYSGIDNPAEGLTGQDLSYYYPSDRLSYAHEIMVGRKFSARFSLQFSAYLVHNNITADIGDKNDIYAIGGLFRYKITRSFAITGEYAYRVNTDYTITPGNYYDSMGIGIEIETGGHVFQINLSNSLGTNETEFIPFTTSSWSNGGIHLGFNITRVFRL